MTTIKHESETFKKKSVAHSYEKRLYVIALPTDTPRLGELVGNYWSIESMHWPPDANLLQDRTKRKSAKAAWNLESIQRIVQAVFPICKGCAKRGLTEERAWLNL